MPRARVVLLVLLAVLASSGFACARALRVCVDGKPLVMSPSPVIHGGRVYVPLAAFRQMGLYVDYRQGSRSGEVAWPKSDLIYDVAAGRCWSPGQMKGTRITLPGTPFMWDGQLMVPLRTPVLDMPVYRDFQVEWNPRTRTANILRSKRWMEWRREVDAELKTGSPGVLRDTDVAPEAHPISRRLSARSARL